MSAGKPAMEGNIGQRSGANHGDRVGEQPDVSIEDDYIAQDGEHLPPQDPVIEDAAPMARCAGRPEPAPRYRSFKEPAPGEIIIGVPPVSQLMTPDIRDTASLPAGLRPPGTPVSASPCAPGQLRSSQHRPGAASGRSAPGHREHRRSQRARPPLPGSG